MLTSHRLKTSWYPYLGGFEEETDSMYLVVTEEKQEYRHDVVLLYFDGMKIAASEVELRYNESLGQISPLQMDRNCCIMEITFKRDLQGFINVLLLQGKRLYLLVRSTSGWKNAVTFLFWEAIGSTLLLSGKNWGQSHQMWWPTNATVVLSNLIFMFLHSN